jgi:AraC-like DNA-binding protein
MSFGAIFVKDTIPLHRIELYRSDHISVELLTGEIIKSVSTKIRIPESTHVLLFVCSGTLLIRRESDLKWTVVAPQAIAFSSGACSQRMNISRGEHRLYVITWTSDAALALDKWIEENVVDEASRGGTKPFPRCKPMPANGMDRISHLDQLLQSGAPTSLPTILSVIDEAVGLTLVGESEIGLSPLPSDLSAVMLALTERVKARPDLPWPLKDASDQVGYSPFHFSRVFKSLVGYGFHEFVDRCRTEYSIRMLTTTDDPIEIIAAAAGFGTAQSLRESVKDHLGLLPSEFREASEDPTEPDSVT